MKALIWKCLKIYSYSFAYEVFRKYASIFCRFWKDEKNNSRKYHIHSFLFSIIFCGLFVLADSEEVKTYNRAVSVLPINTIHAILGLTHKLQYSSSSNDQSDLGQHKRLTDKIAGLNIDLYYAPRHNDVFKYNQRIYFESNTNSELCHQWQPSMWY